MIVLIFIIGGGLARAAVWAVPVCEPAARGFADEWCQSIKWWQNGGVGWLGSVGGHYLSLLLGILTNTHTDITDTRLKQLQG